MIKFFLILMISIFLVNPSVNAEIMTYEGVGEYVMTNFERPESAKKRAQDYAERVAQEKAGIYIKTYTQSKNAKLEHDEVIAISAGIMKILDSTCNITKVDGGFKYHIEVKVSIDSDKIDEWLSRNPQERAELTEQNNELIRKNDEKYKNIDANSQKLSKEHDERGRDLPKAQQIALSKTKIPIADKLVKEKKYDEALEVLTLAIQLDKKNPAFYFKRGQIYQMISEYKRAVIDYNCTISIDANNGAAYYNRGVCYQKLNDDSKSKSDFEKAKSLVYRI